MCKVNLIDFPSVSSHILIVTESDWSLLVVIQFIFNLNPKKRLSNEPLLCLTVSLRPQGLSSSRCCLSWGNVLLPSKLHRGNLKTAVAEQQRPGSSATGME